MGQDQSGIIILILLKLSQTFSKVYILLPSTWSSIQAEDAHQVHEDAEIRVEITNNLYGDTPFTLQTGECGTQGDHIQVDLLSTYVSTKDNLFIICFIIR